MMDTPSGRIAQDTGEFNQVQGPSRGPLWGVAAFALLGAIFSAVSTNDFMQHLDRQVHSIHCSFIPGAGAELGESGCRTVMMSPYSSFFRESLWGGIPVSLWSLATFAFLAYRALLLAFKRSATRAEAGFLLLATGLPLGMSVLYGALAMFKVGASCKVCVGIYVASIGAFVAALLAWRRLSAAAQGPASRSPYVLWFAEGVGFVVVLTLVYLAAIPGSAAGPKPGSCGSLVQGDDPAGVMVELSSRGKVPAIEVVDPLCPACRGFEARLAASPLQSRLALKGVLFPLDSTCNWMVTETLHPGACAVSEAILCAQGLGSDKDPEGARRLLSYALKHQEELRAAAQKDEAALRARLERDFPKVKGCLGGTAVKNKLTKSLRWAVANAIPVLTPQLFVRDRRLCDEDTDLGLEYTLRRAIAQTDTKAGKK
ncbi:MAG: hypothetical protein HY901_38335 [Deltaproteobacteria bacterium]|nr:hypothetical protein [Deltaproteobacteria bacterium]